MLTKNQNGIHILPVIFVVIFTLSMSFSADAGSSSADYAVVLLDGSNMDWRGAREVIEHCGGHILHILPPSALIGRIPESAERLLAGQSPGITVVRSHEDARRLLQERDLIDAGPGASSLSTDMARAALQFLAPPPAPEGVLESFYTTGPDGRRVEIPFEELHSPPRIPEALDPESGQRSNETTSAFLSGEIAVGVIRPESNGTVDPNTENWTQDEIDWTWYQMLQGNLWLAEDVAAEDITYIYRIESYPAGSGGTVSCDYEAIDHNNHDSTVTLNLLGNLGFTGSTAMEAKRAWLQDLKTTFDTDWAYGIFIIDFSTTGGSTSSSANLGGPCIWTFNNRFGKTYRHEGGHIWGALDEYAGPADPNATSGYTKEVNANTKTDNGEGYFNGAGEGIETVMTSGFRYVSPWTLGQWGTWDMDGDNIIAPRDVFPSVTLDEPVVTAPAVSVTGTAAVGVLRRENSGEDVTINKLEAVEWRLNGGAWMDADPQDGAFDEAEEDFTFQTQDLPGGGYIIEVRGVDANGNATGIPARVDVIVPDTGYVNARPMPSVSIWPPVGSTETVFHFSGADSTDIEDGTPSDYRWDWENDGTYDTAWSPNSEATHQYTQAGTITAKMQIRDSGGRYSSRLVEFWVNYMNLYPVADITADTHMIFAESGLDFGLDASGVWDAEDDTADLEVRWDFENDGIWDTAFSTDKTVSFDFAIQYQPMLVSETANYLIDGAGYDGVAQKFVANFASYGKVDLFIEYPEDATPGGTVTCGIKQTRTGPFLSSVTVNQSEIYHKDFNTFTFTPVGVVPGNVYYIVFLSSDDDINYRADNTDPFSGGDAYKTDTGGSSWQVLSGRDLKFRLYSGTRIGVPLEKSWVWRVAMKVRDTDGQTMVAYKDVMACPYNSEPSVTLMADTTQAPLSTTFNFTATGSDPDEATTWDGMLHYRWDFENDGTWDTAYDDANATASHVYDRAGIYNAVVEVRDRFHAMARATVEVKVQVELNGITLMDRTSGSTSVTDEADIFVTFAENGGPTEVKLSEDPNLTGAVWQPYRPRMDFTLSPGYGPKTVYAKVRNGFGTGSDIVSGVIMYEDPSWTATPVPTATPTETPVPPTATPTFTPTPAPPTATPTDPPPTFTPTMTPTFTPTVFMTFTPTPTAPAGSPTYTPIPPFVAMVAPCPNTHDAGCDTFETVTLNSPPDPASLTAANHVLHSGMQSLTTGTFAVNGNSYTYTPDMLFHPGELVTTTITDGVTVMGLPAAPHIWQFRTVAGPAQGVFEDTGDTIPGWGWPSDAELGDLDGDGDLDVAFAHLNTKCEVYMNDGTGSFSQGDINIHWYDSWAVELGDLDGDGDLDLFFASDGFGNAVWFNDGTGDFSDSGQVIGAEENNYDAALGDLDGDGDLDAFVAKESRNHVFLNDGLGYFTQHAILPNLAYSYGIALGDVDGDGDLDGYVANSFESDKLWLNDGLANFTDSGQTLSTLNSSCVAMGDLDGDGDLDAAIGTWQNFTNTVWLNDGTGIFTDSGQTLETANT